MRIFRILFISILNTFLLQLLNRSSYSNTAKTTGISTLEDVQNEKDASQTLEEKKHDIIHMVTTLMTPVFLVPLFKTGGAGTQRKTSQVIYRLC